MNLRDVADSAIEDFKKDRAVDVIIETLKGDDVLSEAEDADLLSLEAHDRRFHGGHFDNETMTCKLRDDLAKTDKPDEMMEKHSKKMAGISNKKAEEYLRLMKKKCPKLDPEETLEQIADIDDRKLQGDAFRWLMKGVVKLPEDLYKVKDARALADKAKKDPLSYDTPQACINDLNDGFKRGAEAGVSPIDPDTVPELSDKKTFPMGVTTYAVQDDRNGQQAMREIINTHWGKDANPWCLLHGDGHGHLSDGTNGGYDAWHYWNHYNALPKRVAFKDGKLLAFMATDSQMEYGDGELATIDDFPEYEDEYNEYASHYGQSADDFGVWLKIYHEEEAEAWASEQPADVPEQWWDRQDASHEGIPLGNMPVPNDKFGRWADFEIRDGELKRTVKFKKGEKGSGSYTEWFANGLVSQQEKGEESAVYYENGNLSRYKNTSTDSMLESAIWTNDGDLLFLFTKDGLSIDHEDMEENDPLTRKYIAEAERIYRENSQKKMTPHDTANLRKFLKTN